MPFMNGSRKPQPGICWKLYFAFLAVCVAVYLVRQVSSPAEFLWGLLSAAVLVGLWGYIRQVPIGWRAFWVLYFIYMAWGALVTLYYLAGSIVNLEKGLFNGLVIGSVLAAPLFVALWRYTFRSPHIWVAKSA